MTEKRLLAILALLIGLVGGLLVLIDASGFIRGQRIDLTGIANSIVGLLLGIAILFGSVLIYRAQYASGGIVNVLLGVVCLVLPGTSGTGGILAIVSGVLALIAAEATR